ncbi:beta-glucosidase [Nemania sp. FL0031]|nr:beta-glucosidase [Nemania sp. FL0031]
MLCLFALSSLLAYQGLGLCISTKYSGPTARTWEDASELADAFVAQLNLTEKVAMVTGNIAGVCDGNINAIALLNFSGLCLHDGPAGIRVADKATLFPAGVTVASTWDRDLMYARAFAMGQEFREKGAHILLGPVSGPLGRHPLGGRNWEGFGVDPYLAGIAMEATVRGHQDAGVQAVSKHYIGNEQETHRMNSVSNGVDIPAISSNIDDRTLHELYLWPFANAVKAGTSSVMCSYNRLNITYTCEHDQALNGILKGELGFQGYIMSDWFATHSGVKSIKAGLDMNMPGVLDSASAALALTMPFDEVPSYFGGNLTTAVQNGTLDVSRLDNMVKRVITPYFYLGQDQDFPTIDPTNIYLYYLGYGISIDTSSIPVARDVRRDHATLVREIAAAGTVLLKNEKSILPIRNVSNVAVFGNGAPDTTDGLYFMNDPNDSDRPLGANIGALAIGGGSGAGRASDLVSPLRAIRDRGFKDGFRTQYITNNDVLAEGNFLTIFPIPDICLVFLKTYALEGWDRPSFENDWNSSLVVKNVAGFCGANKTVVVANSAGVNTLPWNEEAAAIVAAHYPGEQSGNSIVDILWGDRNPSGHLTYTIPKNESDYDIPIVNVTDAEAMNWDAWQSNFTEGLFTDYRHFDRYNTTPLYPFGHGLSYTTFNISSSLIITQLDRKLSSLPTSKEPISPGGRPDLWRVISNVTTTVSNTGIVAGAVVPQLYVSLPIFPGGTPDGTPKKVLRGFEKVILYPGQSTAVKFSLMRRDLSYWSVEDQEWVIPNGTMQIQVGLSSADLKAHNCLGVSRTYKSPSVASSRVKWGNVLYML